MRTAFCTSASSRGAKRARLALCRDALTRFRAVACHTPRHGFINFGLVAQPRPGGPSSSKGTVVIVGAGLAGLAAARQLMVRAWHHGPWALSWAHARALLTPTPLLCTQAFGHKVVIVEARHRAGGRVHTARLWPNDPSSAPPGCTGVGELGGSVLTGTDGNPLAVVARQLGAQLHSIRDKCVRGICRSVRVRTWVSCVLS
jgi:lysine-specific histone demethylase 1